MSKSRSGLAGDIAAIALATPIMAAGMAMFTIPNNLAPGGISGLAIALAELLPAPVGMLTLALNIPIFLISKRTIGWKSLLLTAVTTVYFSFVLDWLCLILPAYTGDRLLSSVYSGALCGAGLGLLMMRGITSGGTDLLALILKKPFPHLPVGTLLVLVDAAVVAFAVVVFRQIEVALYSSITIFIQGKIIDALTQGVNYANVVLIITQKPEKVMNVLVGELGRGVTEFAVKGGYSRMPGSLLLTAAHRSEAAQTLRAAKNADPQAFIIIHNALEIHGEGFIENKLH